MKVTISHYEFLQKFPNETAARTYLEDRRWHGTPVCPHCNKPERVQVRKVAGYFRCLSCKEDFTVRTGTIMERSHIPLDKWLYAMYLMTTARKMCIRDSLFACLLASLPPRKVSSASTIPESGPL